MRPLVDAAAVARELGVSREYVYRHAARFGAVKLPGYSNAPVRFDLERVREALEPVAPEAEPNVVSTSPPRESSRVPLLDIRGASR